MKIVLSWVFDHINASLHDFDAKTIMQLLSLKTVEIESMEVVNRNYEDFAFAQIIEEKEDFYTVIDHLSRRITILKTLSDKSLDRQEKRLFEKTYLITCDHEQKEWRFSTTKDLGAERDFLLPPFHIKEQNIDLKQIVPASEIVLMIDNNAISHRPDLWSHRGFAREIAAILNVPLKPIESLVVSKKLIIHSDSAPATADCPFSITIESKKKCTRFAGLYVPYVTQQTSVLDIAARLCLVDAKPINFLVDATNYVLFDIGQPIHIYDSELLSEKRIVVRNADEQSELTLLDGETINLTKNDIIIADGLQPIALAGIMGGMHAKVNNKTQSLFIESAHFDSLTIRQSAKKYHKRTESAIRFSKNIDPNQNVFGITRYLMLLEQYKIAHKTAAAIESLGNLISGTKIIVTHDFIEKKIGVTLETTKVRHILVSLGFDTQIQGSSYNITVPTYRIEDITNAEDIVEEIVRMFGYSNIPLSLPSVETKPKKCMETIKQKREIKNFLSFGLLMHELSTYAIFDEHFLKKIGYNPQQTVFLKNEVASDKVRLVSTLLVSLIKTVQEQGHVHDMLRFYEIAKIWREQDNIIQEEETVAGIFFDKKQLLDFYHGKQYLDRLFLLLKIDVRFEPMSEHIKEYSLYDPMFSAVILHNNEIIGHCGIIASSLKEIFDKGNAFMFECNYAKITKEHILIRYQEISHFPPVKRDISLLLSHNETAEDLITYLYSFDKRIRSIVVLDIFQKKEWGNKRAVTFRFIIEDYQKTLTSLELDELFNIITTNLTQKGIEIR